MMPKAFFEAMSFDQPTKLECSFIVIARQSISIHRLIFSMWLVFVS